MTPALTVRNELKDPPPEYKNRVLEERARHQASPVPEGPRTWTADGTDGVDASEGVERRQVSLATMPAGPHGRRVALAVVILSTVGFIAALPFIRVPLAQIPAFIPAYESALAINDLITAVLLFGQFTRLRSPALLALASGYLFDAFIMIPHMLSFPGVFSATGLLGAGTQTTAWLYVLWHGGFALFALAYALLDEGPGIGGTMRGQPRRAIACAIGGVAALVFTITVFVTAGHDLLPVVMRGTDFSLLVSKGVSPTIWVLSLLALLALLRRPKPSVLDLWVMVVLSAWLFDVALSAIINSHRYDLGFYAGRLYGLLASCFVLVVLLLETNELQAQLAAANGELEEHGKELEARVRERTAEIRRTNEMLKAEIAERKQAEAQFVQAQKMEAVGNLTGGMAHDFNNLLGVIIGNLDLLRPQIRTIGDADQLAGEALDAATRGADLTRRLLAFARRQPLQPQRAEVNKLVTEIFMLLKRTLGEDVEMSFDLAADVWPVVVDPAQLEASLANLANNARDAMPSGGKLTIATMNRHLDSDYAVQFSEVTPGDYAMIEVSDTGAGMTAEVMNRIFEPFYTTKGEGKGTGLGLSMVFGFIKQSGGHISVYSEPGIGTTFRLYLPRAVDEAAAPDPQVIVTAETGRGETVLAVEDNAGMRRVVVRQLNELGYRVLEAENAGSALELLASARIDLLFTDVIMPGEVNGLELARIALERWPSIKVVLTSGFPEGKINRRGDPVAGFRLLSKPYRKSDLARALREALEGAPPSTRNIRAPVM